MNDNRLVETLAAYAVREITKKADTAGEQAQLARALFDAISDALSHPSPEPTHIGAPNAAVEVIDSASGVLYRRYLELAYDETVNGLRLHGEDIGGHPAELVFLSNTALEKIDELKGDGPDRPPCRGE